MSKATILSPLMVKLKSNETGLPGKLPVSVAVSTVLWSSSVRPVGSMVYRYFWKPLSLHSLIAANPRISCPSSCTTASSAKQVATALESRSFFAFTKASIAEGNFIFRILYSPGYCLRFLWDSRDNCGHSITPVSAGDVEAHRNRNGFEAQTGATPDHTITPPIIGVAIRFVNPRLPAWPVTK